MKVTDAGGNPVSGVSVTFTLTAAPGASITPASPATISTDAAGIATLTSWTLSTTAGPNTVTATSGTLTGSPVTFSATGTAAAAANIAANSATTQSAAAGTNVAAAPSVLVTDTHGNPVFGASVTFTVTAGGGSISPASPASVSTDLAGVATLTSWTLGSGIGTNNNTVTATATLTGSPVTFNASGTAGPATTLAANSVTTQSATVGTAVAAPPSVKVTDAGGNPVSGVSVTFTLTAAPGASIVPASPATILTDGLGVATLTSWTLSTTAGANTVTATSGTLTGSPVTFNATGHRRIRDHHRGELHHDAERDGRDRGGRPALGEGDRCGGNPISGVSVTFTVTAGGGTIVPASPAIIATDVAGIATLTSWTLGSTAGTNTVTATSGTLTGSPVTFNATGTAGSATTIAANSVPAQTATVGTAVGSSPSVLVTDAGGNPVSGVPVTFTVTAGGGTIVPGSPATIATDVNGVATLTSWTLGTTAGANTVTAASGTLSGSPVTFSATGTPGAATTIAANSPVSQSAPEGTAVGSPPSVLVTDAHGNGKPGVSVVFDVTAGGGSIVPAAPATVVTDVFGVATLTSWTLGVGTGSNNNTVTATSGTLSGSPVTFTASATTTAGPASNLAANSPVSQSATAGRTVSAPPSVIVTDANANPVAGASVVFSVASGGGSIVPASPATIVTTAAGTASLTSWTLGTTAGVDNNSITATAGTLAGSPVTFTASATAGGPAQMSIVTQPPATATSGVAFTPQPVLRVLDAHGNPVAGVSVTASMNTGSGSVTGTVTAVTDATGNARYTDLAITGPGSGNHTIRFVASPAGAPDQVSSIVKLS